MVLQRSPSEGFGFSVRGDSPVIVADLEPESVAGVSLFYLSAIRLICIISFICIMLIKMVLGGKYCVNRIFIFSYSHQNSEIYAVKALFCFLTYDVFSTYIHN